MISTRSCSRVQRHLSAAGFLLLSLTAATGMAWGQWQTNGSNIYYIGGKVGIWTSNPQSILSLGTQSGAFSSVGNANTFRLYDDGTNSYGWGINGNTGELAQTAGNGGFLTYYTANTERFRITYAGNVGIGTANPQYKLAVNGNIGAQDIIVTNVGWSDYVFRPGYRLRPLADVRQYILKNGHLPEIPSEADVKQKGVSVGEMQSKLLAKIEELTLHLIQQEQESKELQERLRRLEKRLATGDRVAPEK